VLDGDDGIPFEGAQLPQGCKVFEELVRVLQRLTILSNKFVVCFLCQFVLVLIYVFLVLFGPRIAMHV